MSSLSIFLMLILNIFSYSKIIGLLWCQCLLYTTLGLKSLKNHNFKPLWLGGCVSNFKFASSVQGKLQTMDLFSQILYIITVNYPSFQTYSKIRAEKILQRIRLNGKLCRPGSNCSSRSRLNWIYTLCRPICLKTK